MIEMLILIRLYKFMLLDVAKLVVLRNTFHK